jgi:hypothetical protein
MYRNHLLHGWVLTSFSCLVVNVCEGPLYSRNKQTSNTKEECVHITTQTHKNNTIYICRFQRLLSCIHRVPTHPLLLKIRYEQPKMWEEGRQTWEKEKDMWEECEWKETYIREKRMYHGQWPWHTRVSIMQKFTFDAFFYHIFAVMIVAINDRCVISCKIHVLIVFSYEYVCLYLWSKSDNYECVPRINFAFRIYEAFKSSNTENHEHVREDIFTSRNFARLIKWVIGTIT